MWYTWIVNNFDEPNLISSNIKKDVEIFGVVGGLEIPNPWTWWNFGDNNSLSFTDVYWSDSYIVNYNIVWNMLIVKHVHITIWWLVQNLWIKPDVTTINYLVDKLWFDSYTSIITRRTEQSQHPYCSVSWDWAKRILWDTWWINTNVLVAILME